MPTLTLPEVTTLEEFLENHVDDSGVELHRGQVVRLPMPGFEHGEICVNFGYYFKDFVKKHKLGRVYGNDPFIVIETNPRSCYGPDVVYVSYETLPADQPSPKGVMEPPIDLVVEVRSPTDSMKELRNKAADYLDVGVKVVILVEPDSRTVEIHRSKSPVVTLKSNDRLTVPDLLPGFDVAVKDFFE